MVLIEDAPSAEIAELIAGKLLAAMQVPIVVEGRPLQVSASIGIAFARPVGSAQQLLALADKALYAAKSAGRNTWRLLEG